VSGAAEVLTHGVLEPEGRLVDASNTTLRCRVTLNGVALRCVYKPVAGERPLWDFPDGTLADREIAAFLVSGETGWDLVPPTVRRDGPLGPGACQLWIEQTTAPLVDFVPDRELPGDWHPIARARDDGGQAYTLAHADDPRLARMAIFDAVVNNADRKGGHVLPAPAGRLYGVDHGVCFHVEPKLRTVLWGWAGQPLPAEADPVLAGLAGAVTGPLGQALAGHLTRAEVAALAARVAGLRAAGTFPSPGTRWPAIPWPPI
jgi:uncharacterized repeat protein (TIGR03843 family)